METGQGMDVVRRETTCNILKRTKTDTKRWHGWKRQEMEVGSLKQHEIDRDRHKKIARMRTTGNK